MSNTTPLNADVPRPFDRAPDDRVTVAATRARQTEAPPTPFRDLLVGGVSVLMGGAQVATHVLGAPRLAAAIAGAESRATTVLGTPPGTLGSRIATTAGVGGSAAAPAGTLASTPAGAASSLAGGSDSSDMATMQAMQRESQVFNMQLLELQEEVQQENRRFTTLSNVLRAKHDTAKAAVSNIRS
jgi:hypothetical protein